MDYKHAAGAGAAQVRGGPERGDRSVQAGLRSGSYGADTYFAGPGAYSMFCNGGHPVELPIRGRADMPQLGGRKMNGVDNLGGASFIGPTRHHPDISAGKSRVHRMNRASEKGGGADGAMATVEDYIRSIMLKHGFIDVRAGAVERMRTYVAMKLAEPEEAEVDLDPLTAAELAALLGGAVPNDMNLALRIVARVDPQRVAALLK